MPPCRSPYLRRPLLLNEHHKVVLERMATKKLIDVHTHMYTPRYMNILRSRAEIPKVRTIDGEDRLIILPGEESETTTKVGRPIGKEYWSVQAKIGFMDKHNISHSIVSLANPWLDFLEGSAAESVAAELNDELQDICEQSKGRLSGFATLPVRNKKASLKEIERLKSLSSIKGVILGTPGAGNGLDHENMREVLHSLAEKNLTIFLHPHYGLGNEQYHNTGHALFLALGFPFETTAAVSRLIVTGVLDEIPSLKLLIAHAGAALPSLIARLDSCVAHDLAIATKLQHAPSEYMKRFYFDAISYDPKILQALIAQVGPERIMFGTDNPFFPPMNVPDVTTATWPSTVKVQSSINALEEQKQQDLIKFGNATKLFNLL